MTDPTRVEAVERGVIGELFWNIDDAVFIWRDGRVVAWNPSAEAIFGVAAADALSPGFELAPFFGRQWSAMQNLMRDGGRAEIDCRQDLCARHLTVQAWHLGDDGPDDTTVVVLRDDTAPRRHLEGLAQLNALARELVVLSDIEAPMQRVVDEAKRLTSARFSALVVLREGTENEIAHFVYNAPRELFPERLPRVVGLLAVPIVTRAAARLDDIRGHRHGVGIPVRHPPIKSLLAVPVLAGEAVLGELAVANGPDDRCFDETDEALITELASHVALALTLAGARQAHRQADEERRALTTLALHNIRTPLTVAKGFVATLRHHLDNLTSDMRDDSFGAIDRALDRIQTLAEGALLEDWNKTESLELTLADIDPHQLVEGLFVDVARLSEGVTLRLVTDRSAPPSFPGDPRLVREVLENLLTNAIRFSPLGQQVVVTVRTEGGSVRFDVTDKGPGIAPADQARLFDAPDPARGSVHGRGLWIVRRLVQRMGGTVGLSSRPGDGSTFWLTLPLAAEDVE